MDEKIFIVSDIEMGRGDITDDFSDDDAVVDFLDNIQSSNPGDKLTLVLNGDIFDFLKMAYKGSYTRYITEEISLWKLEEVFMAHPKIFAALKKFLQAPNHIVHFVIGNHDADLAWPALQKRLQKELGGTITFDYSYSNADIHAEHGHLQDPFFIHDTKNPFIEYRGQKILNLPWGSHAVSSHLVKLKHTFPEEERQVPKPLVLKKNKKFGRESKRVVRDLALKSIILNPILRFWDPTRRVPYGKFLKHTMKYGFEYVDDEMFVNDRADEVLQAHPDKKIIVLGHAHVLTDTERQHRKIFVTDTWRNEVDIRSNRQKQKSFVEICYRDGELMTARMKTLD